MRAIALGVMRAMYEALESAAGLPSRTAASAMPSMRAASSSVTSTGRIPSRVRALSSA